MTAAPRLAGLHHLKIPVTDLDAAQRWYSSVFGAHRISRFDHRDTGGRLFAIILDLPGVPTLVELRLDPIAAAGMSGFDPIVFGVDEGSLDTWLAHLDDLGVTHGPRETGFIGSLVTVTGPDGGLLRLYTLPDGGFGQVDLDPRATPVARDTH